MKEHDDQRLFDLFRQQLFGGEEMEAGIEHREGHQLLLTLLIRRQLRTGWSGQDETDPLKAGLFLKIGEEGHHDGLRHIGEHPERTLKVTADRVTDGSLAHVAGLQEEPAGGVGPVPHALPADARLDVLPGQLGDRLLLDRASLQWRLARARRPRRWKRSPAAHLARGRSSRPRVASRPMSGGTAYRTRAATNPDRRVAPARIAMGNEERQQRVPTAGEGHADGAEHRVLLEVVAHTQGQRVEDLLEELFARRSRRRGLGRK